MTGGASAYSLVVRSPFLIDSASISGGTLAIARGSDAENNQTTPNYIQWPGLPHVTPLRATGLAMLVGETICAVVFDSDISINYDPLDGNLQGEKLGTVALEVIDVRRLRGFSSSSLPEVDILSSSPERFLRPATDETWF